MEDISWGYGEHKAARVCRAESWKGSGCMERELWSPAGSHIRVSTQQSTDQKMNVMKLTKSGERPPKWLRGNSVWCSLRYPEERDSWEGRLHGVRGSLRNEIEDIVSLLIVICYMSLFIAYKETIPSFKYMG